MGRASVGRGGTARVRGQDRLRSEIEDLRRDEQNREMIRIRDYVFPSRPATKTTGFTVDPADKVNLYLLDTSSGNVTATLPLAADHGGFRVTLLRTSTANTAAAVANAADTMEGYSTILMRVEYEALTLESDGSTTWRITNWKKTEPARATAKSGTYTISVLDEERTWLVSGTGWQITLPACDATTVGRRYVFKKTDSGTVSVKRAGTDKIEGANAKNLVGQYAGVVVFNPDGGGTWYIEN